MTTPPSSGPTVKPRLNEAVDKAFADGSKAGGSSRGMIAARAGLLTA